MCSACITCQQRELDWPFPSFHPPTCTLWETSQALQHSFLSPLSLRFHFIILSSSLMLNCICHISRSICLTFTLHRVCFFQILASRFYIFSTPRLTHTTLQQIQHLDGCYFVLSLHENMALLNINATVICKIKGHWILLELYVCSLYHSGFT